MQRELMICVCMVLSMLMPACTNTKLTRTTAGVEAGQAVVARATVVEIDPVQHTAVLKDADGTLQYVNLGPDAKHLDQVKPGDVVVAEVVESVEVVVEDSAAEPSMDLFEAAQRNPDRPGAQKVTVTEATARVEKVDYENRLVTLRGSKGRTITTQVGPEVKRLEQIKPGDMIKLRTTKQTMIRVETP